MKKQWPLFVALFTLSVACSPGGDKKVEELSKTTAAKVAEPKIDGSRIYKTYCVTCHGLYGDMGSVGAFDLTQTTLTMEEKIEVITNGRNTMGAYAELLTPEQIIAVAEFTETLKR